MNGAKKFHSPDGPAFNTGEIWKAADGRSGTVTIKRVDRYGPQKWDVDVLYTNNSDILCTKNCWSFQVRYQHIADANL